jgi:microcin C transport system substrate-binding protein
MSAALPSRTLRTALLGALAAAVLLGAGLQPATAAEMRHGLSAFGDLALPADFTHLPYVDPAAPKGGRMSMIGPAGRTTFDSFNGYILKGDAAQGLELLFDSLMARNFDEPDAVYGLVASGAAVAPDGGSVTFALRPEARFADGSPLTAADVVFSFEALKSKGHPNYAISLRDVNKAEALDERTVRYTFTGELVRDLPVTVAMLPIFSKAYYERVPFDQTSLDAPLGSGPYRLADFRPGSFVSYKRRDDYWAKDLAVSKGRFNFDELRYDYFRDRNVELENLFNGSFDFREEFTSLHWATAYDKPAVKDGRIQRLTLPDESPSGTQGFFINTRRSKLADARVRKALDLAFDYEWTNKNIFFGLYKRTTSYFENSDMKAEGKPSSDELALLEPFRDKLPAEVFETPYVPPQSDGSGADRKLLRAAAELLTAAGYEVKNGRRVNANGEPLDIEFLIFDSGFERILGPYVENLKRIGVGAEVRRVDPAQYQRRLKSFDFDIVTQRYSMRLVPGVELNSFFGTGAARMDGSFNLAAISDPVVDALIAKATAAKSRAELVAATRALDRVLRTGHYWVPHWYKASHHLAFWNRFSWPPRKPRYDRGVIDTWWYDPGKAATLRTN